MLVARIQHIPTVAGLFLQIGTFTFSSTSSLLFIVFHMFFAYSFSHLDPARHSGTRENRCSRIDLPAKRCNLHATSKRFDLNPYTG